MKHALLLASLSALTAMPAAAALPWTYVEGGYSELDTGGFEPDGLALEGRYQLDPRLYLVGDVKHYDEDNVDIDMLSLGGGYRFALTGQTDGYVGANFERIDTRFGDDSGYSLNAGVRSMVVSNLELNGEIGYYDVDDGDVTLKIAANYYFAPRWALGVSHEDLDNADVTQVTVRYAF